MSITEDLAKAVKEKDEAGAKAALQAEKDKFGLDALDAAAEQRLAYLAGRAAEVSAILKETAAARDARDNILQKHHRLVGYFDAVDAKRDRLRDLVFGAQSRLVRARADLAGLTEADLTPRKEYKEEWLYFSRWGAAAPRIFKVYEQLSPAGKPLAEAEKEIDEALAQLREARRVLNERLASVAGRYAATGDGNAPAR